MYNENVMIPEIEELVEELEELREKLGYSQPELANQLDVGVSTLQNWLYDEANPRYENLKKIEQWLEENREKVR